MACYCDWCNMTDTPCPQQRLGDEQAREESEMRPDWTEAITAKLTFTIFDGMDLVVRQGCDDFAPDSLAPDPVMRDFCTSCLGHRSHHEETK